MPDGAVTFLHLQVVVLLSIAAPAICAPCLRHRGMLAERTDALAQLEAQMQIMLRNLALTHESVSALQKELAACEASWNATAAATAVRSAHEASWNATAAGTSVRSAHVKGLGGTPPSATRRALDGALPSPAVVGAGAAVVTPADCYFANSSFVDRSCNCLGLPIPAGSDSRPTVKIIVGSWTAAEIDAFLLGIVIEEYLGYPVEMMHEDIIRAGLAGNEFAALARGDAHIYPEVSAARHGKRHDASLLQYPAASKYPICAERCERVIRSDRSIDRAQVWPSDQGELYEEYVVRKGTVRHSALH